MEHSATTRLEYNATRHLVCLLRWALFCILVDYY